MNGKNQKSTNAAGGGCFCGGAGPVLTELFRRMGPPEEARQHFDAARVEFLKGMRAVLDARIEHLSKPRAKGRRVTVE